MTPKQMATIHEAKRRLFAQIIASAHLLDQPFTNAPDQSPWTRIKRDMYALDHALRAAEASASPEPSSSEGT